MTRLLKVGSMAGSMGAYLPAVAFQRAVALARVLLFIYLMPKVEYGLWGLGAMVFSLGAPIVTLGSHLGLARYVSFYEARGTLCPFYRHIRWRLAAIIVAVTLLALAASHGLTDLVIASRQQARQSPQREQLMVCWAALLNAMLMAMYFNQQSFMAGMRVYRLSSTVEVCYAVTFTVLGAGSLWFWPTALALLLAHAASLGASLALGGLLLHAGMKTLDRPAAKAPRAAPALPPAPVGPPAAPVAPAPAPTGPLADGAVPGAMWKVLSFGLVALLGSFLWLAAGYVSFWMTSRQYGQEKAGDFFAFLQLGQLVFYLAGAAWAVVFAHAAKRWEAGDRTTALFTLQTAYKAVALTMMTLTILAYATSDLWVRLLPRAYLAGLPLLGGLLMFFQVMIHLALTTMLANLRQRPSVIAWTALAGGAANAVLAAWWLPLYGAQGAAWAAGIGMFAGTGLATAAYLLLARPGVELNTVLVFASPALLVLMLLPAWWVLPAIWAAVLAVVLTTHAVFSPREAEILLSYLRQAGCVLRRAGK